MLDQLQKHIENLYTEPNTSPNINLAIQLLIRMATLSSFFPNGDLKTVLNDLEEYLRKICGFKENDKDLLTYFLKVVVSRDIELSWLKGLERHLDFLSSNEAYRTRFKNNMLECNWNVDFFRNIYSSDFEIADEYLFDCLEVHALINNRIRCNSMLQQLEDGLQKYAVEINAPLVDYNGEMKMLPHNQESMAKGKILSGFLYRWAKENGFNKTNYAKILGTLTTDEFFSVLSQRLFFKDAKVFPPLHGAWSHALQFYIIIEANKKDKFLTHDPVDFYAFLGDPKNKSKDSIATLWYMMLDRMDARLCGI